MRINSSLKFGKYETFLTEVHLHACLNAFWFIHLSDDIIIYLCVPVRLPVVTVDAESGDVSVDFTNTVPLNIHSRPIATTLAIFEEYVMHSCIFLDRCNNT